MIRVLASVAIVTGCAGPATTEKSVVPALYFAKNGALYVSDPAGTPARKLTDGPGDTQPAPSPDGKRVAYVHKSDSAEPGGELRVLDVASGTSRRLIDPAALVPQFEGDRPQVNNPNWSPAGDRIAFLKATFGGGGFLLTANPDTGAVQAPQQPLFADFGYSWSPDGTRIAWAGGRSDVSPVDVNVLTVGGASTPVAKDTNAFAVSYSTDGESVLFGNGDATGSPFVSIPFALRDGGIYSVQAPAAPTPLIAAPMFFPDVQGLASGEVGYTEASQDQRTKTILILGKDGKSRKIAETPGDAQRPVWNAAGSLAYVGIADTADDRPLLVTANGSTTRVDTGVEVFAWGYTGG